MTYRKVNEDGELVEVEAPEVPIEPETGVIYTAPDGTLCRFDGWRLRPVSPAELD
jgi:hypothetical protein